MRLLTLALVALCLLLLAAAPASAGSPRHALVAFQKVEGRARTGRLTKDELQALKEASRPRPLEGAPAHVEIDIARQVLFVVDDAGEVVKILSVSTGNEGRYYDQGRWHVAHTPRGRFTVERKINGWRRSTLGLLYYPNYFSEGVAIHGSPSIPVRPASHGCIRIPMPAAKEFGEMTPVGTPVVVHDGGEQPVSSPPMSARRRRLTIIRHEVI